jgi:S-adenosylmethionine:tRNA ribosyltransferase-isomerase
LIPASVAVQRPPDAKLLVVDGAAAIHHLPRSAFIDLLHPGDLVVANDAATLPASLQGQHLPSGREIEIRLAGRPSLSPVGVRFFSAVVFGEGDFHTRTENRPLPPALTPGDRLVLGPLRATVERVLGHPRLMLLRFDGSQQQIWEGLARHGRPIQYSHVQSPLAVWDVWTSVAGLPVAFEPPSAGFALDWNTLRRMRMRGIAFQTITHAAGISSTGDPDLDRLLPFDEPYMIPAAAASAIDAARARGGRIIAIGTTVVRALEDAVSKTGKVRIGAGVATQRIGPASKLRMVDMILSGTHEPGTSHYELLRAFIDDATLSRATEELETCSYRTHEFGDSVLIARSGSVLRRAA